MKQKKNLIIYDTDDFELVPILEGVNSIAPCKFDLFQMPENIELNKHRSGKKDELKRYINYFKGGFKMFLHRKEYAHIICWQQFYALTFAFFCNVFHVKKPCQVIAGNYAYKEKGGKAGKLYYWFMKKCLERDMVDFVHIPSNLYAEKVCATFGIDKSRVIIQQFGIIDEYEKFSSFPAPVGFNKESFFLAIGRSNRDYDFLLDVWQEVKYPLVIISDTYERTTNNPFITIRHDVSADHQYNWINNCKANIICLKDGNYASGDTVLLSSMSLERIVIVSEPSTLAEMYIENEANGITVRKDADEFRNVINAVINGQYDHIGKAARKSFLENFSREQLGKAYGKYVR